MQTSEAIKKYQKEYHSRYRLERKADRLERERLKKEPPLVEVVRQIDYNPHIYRGSGSITCSHFGCGRELSITEQLFGKKCIHHSIK